VLVAVPSDDVAAHWAAVTAEQLAAAASPHQPIREVVGNFDDLVRLVDQLSEPVVAIELGKPIPYQKFIARSRIGSCHAAHNRGLLDD
jgi:hypothetical protein